MNIVIIKAKATFDPRYILRIVATAPIIRNTPSTINEQSDFYLVFIYNLYINHQV